MISGFHCCPLLVYRRWHSVCVTLYGCNCGIIAVDPEKNTINIENYYWVLHTGRKLPN
jgi:hypothetical protein